MVGSRIKTANNQIKEQESWSVASLFIVESKRGNGRDVDKLKSDTNMQHLEYSGVVKIKKLIIF